MKELSFETMEEVNGGSFNDFCYVVGTGSVLYALGLATNWWNPVGWVSAGFIAADVVCLLYNVA